jgi:alpha-galactosidase
VPLLASTNTLSIRSAARTSLHFLNRWIWQFHAPETGGGVVQAFRCPESGDEAIQVKLHGLTPEAVYTLTNLDVAGTTEMTGRELIDAGLRIAIKDRPGAAGITYKKKP